LHESAIILPAFLKGFRLYCLNYFTTGGSSGGKMGQNFKKNDPDQDFLLPVSSKDWVEDDHAVRFVLKILDKMNLEHLKLRYRSDGRGGAAFEPTMMMKLLVSCYVLGLRSTRKMEEACRYDLRLRLICGEHVPDHSTISRFRKDNSSELEHVFLESLRLSNEANLVRPVFLAVDGSKISANASKKKNLSFDEVEARRQIRRYLEECDEVDAAEDAIYGEEGYPDRMPEELSTEEQQDAFLDEAFSRMKAEQEKAKEEQEKKIAERERQEKKAGRKKPGSKPKPPERVAEELARKQRVNTTDPDSRMMKDAKGFEQAYNVQLAVTAEQIITAVEVSSDEVDYELLHPMVEKTRKNLKAAHVKGRVGTAVADAGYATNRNFEKAEADQAAFYISTHKDRKLAGILKDSPVATGPVPEGLTPFQRMGHRLRTKRGRKMMARRGQTVEAVFGQLKFTRGFNRFMMRGREPCQAEAFLFAAVHNIGKLARFEAAAVG